MYPEYKNISMSFPLFSNESSVSSSSSLSINATENVINANSNVITGPQKMANAFKVKYLGSLPMDPSVLSCGEQGAGLIEVYPQSIAAAYLSRVVDSLISYCDERVTSTDSSA